MNRSVKLNGTVIQGASLKYPRTPEVILGDNNGYEKGDILDANAVTEAIKEGGGSVDPEIINELRQEMQSKADSSSVYTKQEIDEAGYLTEHQDISGKVDKIDNKGLSTNDYTNEDKAKLAGLSNYDDTEIRELIAGKQDTLTKAKILNLLGYMELPITITDDYAGTTQTFYVLGKA